MRLRCSRGIYIQWLGLRRVKTLNISTSTSDKITSHFWLIEWQSQVSYFSVVVTGTFWAAGLSFQTVTVRFHVFNGCCGGGKALLINLKKFLMNLSQLWHWSGVIKRVLRQGGRKWSSFEIFGALCSVEPYNKMNKSKMNILCISLVVQQMALVSRQTLH